MAGAPGWRVVERTIRSAPPNSPQRAPSPQLASLRSNQRADPRLPWVAGAVLSLLVLALTLADQSWLDWLAGRSPAVSEPALVVGPIEEALPPMPAQVVSQPAPAAAVKPTPRVVPISPDGRGTARFGAGSGTPQQIEAPPSAAPRSAPTVPTLGESRVLPISLERPRPAPPQGVQLVGAEPADAASAVELVDFGRDPSTSAREAAGAGRIRLFIHYTAALSDDAATVARLAEYLSRRGFEVAAIRPVDVQIGSADVRYFSTRDRAESQRLLEDLGWFFRGAPQRAPQAASDFTHYTPKPRPGNVEIWLPSAS